MNNKGAKVIVLLLILISGTLSGCAEVILGPLIGGPIGTALEKAVREKGTTPSSREGLKGTPSAEDR